MTDPFTALGLPARPGLPDEQVRAAWRQIAAATHPDRPDGGDLARYTQATAAYAQLRTPWARSEAYADLAEQHPGTYPFPALDPPHRPQYRHRPR
jgi:curved DNA-binding protein CbpA